MTNSGKQRLHGCGGIPKLARVSVDKLWNGASKCLKGFHYPQEIP